MQKKRKHKQRPVSEKALPTQMAWQRWEKMLRWATWSYVILLTLLLWLPDPRVLLWGWQPAGKAMGYSHLITFSILGFLVEQGRRDRSFFRTATLLFGYALLTEIVQELLPIRSFEIIDIAQDLAGLYFGLWCAAAIRRMVGFLLDRQGDFS